MGQAFIVGNSKGNLNIHSFTGDIISSLDTLPAEVSHLKIDQNNHMYLTLADSMIAIQQHNYIKVEGENT
jgi:hypothetical protein